MSAIRRIPGHTCRTFVTVAEVLSALATRNDRRLPRRAGLFDRTLAARVFRALEKTDVTHRCAACKRWVSVTPTSFTPAMTHGELTRLTKAEARQLAARPIVFTVSPVCEPTDAPYLAKLPAYGFDVRHPQTQELRGAGTVPWKYQTWQDRQRSVKFARNAR